MGNRRIGRAVSALVAGLIVAGGVLVFGSPAQAASYCYEGSSVTNSKSLNFYDITVHESLTYKPVYDCSRIQVGVHVTGATASYSGGSASSTVGIDRLGVVMQQVGGTMCGPVGPYMNSVSPTKRSVSGTYDHVIYNGSYKDCYGNSYGYDQTCTYIHLNKAFHIQNIAFSGWFRSCLNSSSIDRFVET